MQLWKENIVRNFRLLREISSHINDWLQRTLKKVQEKNVFESRTCKKRFPVVEWVKNVPFFRLMIQDKDNLSFFVEQYVGKV